MDDKVLSCPECGRELTLNDGRVECPEGHTWKVRRSTRPCPRCGERYFTFGVPSKRFPLLYRNIYRVCRCGWYEVKWCVYVGPAEGRGYRGQRWSPVTGRLLVR